MPGLGRRSAQRIALYLLKNKDRSLLPFIKTLETSHKLIVECSNCGNEWFQKKEIYKEESKKVIKEKIINKVHIDEKKCRKSFIFRKT